MLELSELEYFIKAQAQNELFIRSIGEQQILYCPSSNYGVLVGNGTQEYQLNSELKTLFLRKRKNGIVKFEAGNFYYNDTCLPTGTTPLPQQSYKPILMAYLSGNIAQLKMQDKDDIANWSNRIFICLQDNVLYCGLTNLNEITTLQCEAHSEGNKYFFIEFNPTFYNLDFNNIELAFYTDFVVISDTKNYYIAPTASFDNQLIKQWNILIKQLEV